MDAVILTAGKGTRLLPITKNLPKPLFPIAGKPLLCHILDSLTEKISKVVIVVGHEKDQIKNVISNESYPFKILWVNQDEQKGTGHAISLCEEYISSNNFFMMYGDIHVRKKTVQEIISIKLREKQLDGTIAGFSVDTPQNYGCLELEKGRLKKIWEKHPNPPSNIINAGAMILPKRIFSILKQVRESKRGEIELTDGINHLVNAGGKLSCYEIKDYWTDTGYPWDLLTANKLGLEEDIVGEEISLPSGVHIEGSAKIASSAKLRPGTYIQGPVIIDEDSVIGPNTFIRSGTYIGKEVRIGNGVEIKNSIILDGTTIGHLSYIGDSIIGRNCNFGAGTKVANLRLDNQQIKMKIKDERISSGLRKLGIVMGDNVKTGINVSFMPGISIGENAQIGAHTLVSNDIPSSTLVYYDPNQGMTKKKVLE
jgi:bifunctional UDP-N-acetylglucosamine pyrophosphorylase/glucosamine-1-phosphate N-acetyltransferase